MWEELHVKYPNDSRVEKELITALCSRNEVADFDKIFYHVVRLLRTRQEQNIEDKVLGALKGYILNAVQPKKEEEKFVHSGRKPADAAGKLPQREVDKIKDSYGVKYAKPKGKMVLVADDAAIIRIMVRKLLERKGFEVAEAEDGRQAVEKFDEIKPDFVVMDINMPEMDGITALSEIMKKADVPVIMLSAMCEIAYVNKAFGAGAVDFICKPFANDVFTERVTGLYK
jgi:two-component system chemotaxis response regulator CheY